MAMARIPELRLEFEQLETRDVPSMLLAVRPTLSGTATQLVQIDTVTRQTSVLGVIPAKVADIAGTDGGELYGVIAGDTFSTASQGEVVRIDTTTMAVNTIVRSDALDDAFALAAAPDGTLYAAAPVGLAASGGRLFRVTPHSGAPAFSGGSGAVLDPTTPYPYSREDSGLAFVGDTLFYTRNVGINGSTYPSGKSVNVFFSNNNISVNTIGLGHSKANIAFVDNKLFFLDSSPGSSSSGLLLTLDPITRETTGVMGGLPSGITGITRVPTATAPPDITVTSAALNGDGNTATFNYNITGVASTFQAALYRSADATFSSDDTLVTGLQPVTPTGSAGSANLTVLTPLLDPTSTRPYLLAVVDPLGVLAETNEGNNAAEVVVRGAVPDPLLETLSRAYAYRTHQLGDRVGFGYSVGRVFSDSLTGFYALGLTSLTGEPILAFRGTEPTSPFDVFTDTDPAGVGYDQFLANRGAVRNWLTVLPTANGAATLTGHSLGGALAQWFAADHTAGGGSLAQVVTFNSPGISKNFAATFRPANVRRVWHYVVNGDAVSLAGEAFLTGGYTLASFDDYGVQNFVNKHGLPLLTRTADGTRLRPDGLTLRTFDSTAWLNSPYFLYTDVEYYLWLAGAQVAVNTIPLLSHYRGVPASMIFRSTVEQNRRTIGTAWREIAPTILFDPTLGSLRVTLPPADLALSRVQMRVEDMELTYSTTESVLQIQGQVLVPTLYNATADFAGSNFIKITDTGLDAVGRLSVQNVVLVRGQWEIPAASLAFDTVRDTVDASATVRIPSGLLFNATLGFVAGEFNSASVGVSNLGTPAGTGLPIGATGAFLQSMSGEIAHVAVADPLSPEFTGSVVVTGGPQITVPLPSWAGGPVTASLLRVEASATISGDLFRTDGTVTLLGGVATGQGRVVFDWERGYLNVDAVLRALGNLVELRAGFTINSNLDFFAPGQATGRLPNIEGSLLFNGQELASGMGYIQYRNNGIRTDDYVQVQGVVHVPGFGDFALGLKVDLDGELTVIGDLAQLPRGSTAEVPPGTRRLILTTQWATTTPAAVEVLGPDGRIYSEADIRTSASMFFLDALSGPRSRSVGILDPEPGSWTIRPLPGQALGTVEDAGYTAESTPSVAFTGLVAGTRVTIGYTATSASPQATVSLFYDALGLGFRGILVAAGLPVMSGQGTFVWDAGPALPGPYTVYAILSDGSKSLSIASSVPPAFTSTPGTTAATGQVYAYSVTASTPYASRLSFRPVTMPAWLALTDNGNGTATLTGTPGPADTGTYPVTLQASDGIAPPVFQTFTLVARDLAPPAVAGFYVLYGNGRRYDLATAARLSLPWAVTGFQVVFTEAVSATAASLELSGRHGALPVSVFSGSGTDTLTWVLATPVTLDRVSVALATAGANAPRDAAGNLVRPTDTTFEVSVVWGDMSGDRRVMTADRTAVRNAITYALAYDLFLDVNGDGVVDAADLTIVSGRVGTGLV